jgi:hypothetical protein
MRTDVIFVAETGGEVFLIDGGFCLDRTGLTAGSRPGFARVGIVFGFVEAARGLVKQIGIKYVGVDGLFFTGFYPGLPGGDIAAHPGLLTIAVACLMTIGEVVPMVGVTGPDIYIETVCREMFEVIGVISCRVIRTDPFLPHRGHSIDQDGAADPCAIQTSGGSFDNFERLDVVKSQLIQISVPPGVGKRDLVPVDLDISDAKRRAKTAAADIEAVAAG